MSPVVVGVNSANATEQARFMSRLGAVHVAARRVNEQPDQDGAARAADVRGQLGHGHDLQDHLSSTVESEINGIRGMWGISNMWGISGIS
jgi:hypothetical protein